MEPSWMSILIEIGGAVATIIVSILGVVGVFVVKRVDNKLKMKLLNDEIKQMVDWSKNSDSLKLKPHEEQIAELVEQLREFAAENNIMMSDSRLKAMIEHVMSYPLRMERKVRTSLQLKEQLHED